MHGKLHAADYRVRLARSAAKITVLDVVDAIEGHKPLFDCQEIRGRCAVFKGKAPAWSTQGVCSIHAVMLRAEQSMRAELARATLADLATTVARKAPAGMPSEIKVWLSGRLAKRSEARLEGRAAQAKQAAASKQRRRPEHPARTQTTKPGESKK